VTALDHDAARLDEDRLRRLIAAGRSLVAERELEQVFQRLLEVARELTGASYAAIGILDDAREKLAEVITDGIDRETKAAIGALPRGRGILGQLINHPEPLRLSDISEDPRASGFPAGHPPMKSFLGVPIVIRGEVWGNLYLTNKSGSDFDEADEETTVVLAAWAGVAVENARLYRQTDQRRVELERSVRALQATSEIAQAVGGETRLDRVLELIAKRSRALVEASSVVILLAEGEQFVIAACAGQVSEELAGARVAATGSMAGRVLAAGRPERIDDLSRSARLGLDELGLRPTSALLVPLVFRGVQVGVIEAFDRVDGPAFRVEDEWMLLAAAASAATAVATAQSVERERLRRSLNAAEEERRRWARELHDETLQALGGLRVLLASARRRDDVESLRAVLDRAVEQLGEEITNLRALITELRPAALDELGLRPALEALIDRARTMHGLAIDATLELEPEPEPRHGQDDPARLHTDIETAIYRVIQESLTNAARHARAERVQVVVLRRGAELLLTIRDDGHGFDIGTPSAGFGLTSMRERISLVGGQIEIISAPTGTTIAAIVPIDREPVLSHRLERSS
jgi:two-component system, NarL family, sensor histidine kinase DevS